MAGVPLLTQLRGLSLAETSFSDKVASKSIMLELSHTVCCESKPIICPAFVAIFDLCCPAPALPCPALPCPALPCPALPCPALPCPALPCPALPCPALPCPALPCPSISGQASKASNCLMYAGTDSCSSAVPEASWSAAHCATCPKAISTLATKLVGKPHFFRQLGMSLALFALHVEGPSVKYLLRICK